MLAGVFRGTYLARLVRRQRIAVIETWPMGVSRRIPVSQAGAKDSGDEWRHAALTSVVEGLERVCADVAAGYRDQLDSVAAAYAAWCQLKDRATSVGDAAAG